MKNNHYLLFCGYCHYKKISDGTDAGLVEIPTSPIIAGIPFLSKETNTTINPKYIKQKKRFKCPNCGRVIFPQKYTVIAEKRTIQSTGIATGNSEAYEKH